VDEQKHEQSRLVPSLKNHGNNATKQRTVMLDNSHPSCFLSGGMFLFLCSFGLIAGFIDSIAGGGGLITLPVLLSILGSGPEAIGTNKIVGASAALVALLVYRRAGHFDLKHSVRFSLAVGLGSVLGSFITPHLPDYLFRWFILILSPFILWLIWQKESGRGSDRHSHGLQANAFYFLAY
jgi:uncharacterized membrane protein YfcA